MSVLKSINNMLLKVKISSNNACVFIHDLSDLTLQIIFDGWWASVKVGLKRPIVWDNSGHAHSW